MPRIEFRPSGRTVSVSPGTELGDAARLAGASLDMPCGGKGTCGRCLVRVLEGIPEFEVSAEPAAPGYILACRSRAGKQDLVLEMPESEDRSGDRYDDRSEYDAFLSEIMSTDPPDPLCAAVPLEVPAARLDDGLSDLERLLRSFKSRIDPEGVSASTSALRELPAALRAADGKITLTLCGEEGSSPRLVRVKPGKDKAGFGIAVDLGTTTVAVQLLDPAGPRILSTRSGYNGQIACGLDVISRINYARTPDRLAELRERALETVNRMIERSVQDAGIDKNDITSAVLSGNTVMMHLFLGVDPEYLRLEPYTPAFLDIPMLSGRETGLLVHPDAGIYFSPCVGSYVGGDITAGLLCSGLVQEGEGVSLFIDIGTNGEIVLGNRDFLMTCACSAGPAFEGGGIDHGMRATDGAIDRVSIDPATGDPSWSVIGQVKPRGICGSGMIELLAGLFLGGWLDSSGKLARHRDCARIRFEGRRAHYVLVPAGESATGRDITVSEVDIDNIMRAKAAIYSACALILGHAGMEFGDLEHVYIAGGFGRYLDIGRAIVLGLLPEIPPDRYRYIGNASLKGSSAVLLSRRLRGLQAHTARRMTYINLSGEPGYMDQYTAALFLPHTDFGKFPGVAARLKGG